MNLIRRWMMSIERGKNLSTATQHASKVFCNLASMRSKMATTAEVKGNKKQILSKIAEKATLKLKIRIDLAFSGKYESYMICLPLCHIDPGIAKEEEVVVQDISVAEHDGDVIAVVFCGNDPAAHSMCPDWKDTPKIFSLTSFGIPKYMLEGTITISIIKSFIDRPADSITKWVKDQQRPKSKTRKPEQK